MFKTAGVHFIRCVFSALSFVSLAALLSACTHLAPPDPGGAKSWVVENVASKSTAELYADVIRPGVFERSSSKVIDGYTVESGNWLMPDGSVGSLVSVRSGDGSLTAKVEQPGNNGLLVVNNKGESRFTPYPAQDFSLPDTVTEKENAESGTSKRAASAGPYVIDMLIGYSRSAADAAGGDAHANALAQVESVNLALRNSLVTNVSMRLVGVQVVEANYPIASETVGQLPEIFAAGMQQFEPDMLYGIFSGHPSDTGVGWGQLPGWIAIGYVYGEAFRHEVGHNAGGNHCHEAGGGYNHGFNNGKSTTAQCGNGSPYYSNPAVRDQHGLPMGNVVTADMARVWRENAERLSSYAHFAPSAPTGFSVKGTTPNSITFSWNQSPRAVKYEIWGQGLSLPKKYGEFTATEGTISDVHTEKWFYYMYAVYSDGTKSPRSTVLTVDPKKVR